MIILLGWCPIVQGPVRGFRLSELARLFTSFFCVTSGELKPVLHGSRQDFSNLIEQIVSLVNLVFSDERVPRYFVKVLSTDLVDALGPLRTGFERHARNNIELIPAPMSDMPKLLKEQKRERVGTTVSLLQAPI